jgi:CheY-like chemotaxis protein
MGGTIWVESFGSIGGNPPTPCSDSFTQGSTFYFTLKLIADTTCDSLKSAHFDQKEHSLPTSPLKILLAEDNAVNQKVMIRILQRLGYGADIASNGLKVLEALTKQKYDLIFMDMQMPEMDGIEATQRICQLYPISIRPHIIAMTANAMPSDRQACLAAGMDDYISKPVRIEELLAILKNVEIISLGRE